MCAVAADEVSGGESRRLVAIAESRDDAVGVLLVAGELDTAAYRRAVFGQGSSQNVFGGVLRHTREPVRHVVGEFEVEAHHLGSVDEHDLPVHRCRAVEGGPHHSHCIPHFERSWLDAHGLRVMRGCGQAIDDDDVDSAAAKLESCRQPDRAGADDQDGCFAVFGHGCAFRSEGGPIHCRAAGRRTGPNADRSSRATY